MEKGTKLHLQVPRPEGEGFRVRVICTALNQEKSVNRLVGIILVALSAAGFGTLALFGKYAYADGMDALTILFLRFSLSACVMLALLIVRRESLPRGATLLRLIGTGVLYIRPSVSSL